MMAELSAMRENASQFRVIDEARVEWLGGKIDSISHTIEMPKEFIVPGDSFPGAVISLARSIVRRAERRVAELHISGDVDNPQILPYLNRLSSLCFVLELRENKSSDITLAKKDLKPGTILDGEGGYTVYGLIERADIARDENLLPMGLTKGAEVISDIPEDSAITYEDVKLQESFTLSLRRLQDSL